MHSITVITLLLRALDRVPTQEQVFDHDAYESRRYLIIARRPVPVAPASAGLRLTSDWTISLPGWPGVVLRLAQLLAPGWEADPRADRSL